MAQDENSNLAASASSALGKCIMCGEMLFYGYNHACPNPTQGRDYENVSLTLRDQFAMAALSACIEASLYSKSGSALAAEAAYEIADAMLIARKPK